MILANVIFGTRRKNDPDKLKDTAGSLNDSQISAVVRMTTVEQTVSDISLLRDVMLETYRLSRHYHPGL